MSQENIFADVLHHWVEVFMHHSMQNFRLLFEDTGLSHSQVFTLFQLDQCESCGVSDIGEHLGITNAAASQLIDRLVQQELIVREEDPKDRRFKRIFLTAKGRGILDKSMENRQRWVASLTAALTPTEQKTIIEALNLLTFTVQKLESEGHPTPADPFLSS